MAEVALEAQDSRLEALREAGDEPAGEGEQERRLFRKQGTEKRFPAEAGPERTPVTQ